LSLLARLGGRRDGLGKPFLVGTGDEDLWFIVEHRGELAERYDVLHPSNDAMVTCLDKALFQRFCESRGLSAPAAFVCRANADDVRRDVRPSALPLVARHASRSQGGTSFPKMFRLDTAADIDALVALLPGALRPDDELLFNESLLHRDVVRYSVALCRARGTCLAFEAVKERPSASTGEVGTYVTLADAPEARALALRAAEALDYYGMGEMEVFHDRVRDRHFAIELNARPWMQLGMEPLAGTDFLGFLAGRSAGTVGPRHTGAAWIDVLGDLFWRRARRARGDGDATSDDAPYLPSLMRVRAFKYFALGDPGPALFEAARQLRRIVRRRLAG
jgi:predicted ATP-grasp superfamily ATP-dependent carboligase